MEMEIDTDNKVWSEGKFQILFLSMGQGDCCVITCPDGRHLMIDCGSKAQEKDVNGPMIDVQKNLRGEYALGLEGSVKNELEALILTHPDEDHINKVDEVLSGCIYKPVGVAPIPFPQIKVKKVYFSDYDRTRYDFKQSPLRRYDASRCKAAIYDNPGLTELNCVTLNREEKVVERWTPLSFSDPDYSWEKITGDSLTIVDSGDDRWSVSIIAGNVKKETNDTSDVDGRNAASLVTLIRIGEEKILICGDATFSTENYLVDTFKEDIQNVSLLQAPHHGSGVTSSTKKFLDLVRPKNVAISVQKYEHTHHLPSEGPIKEYVKSVETDELHPVHYWSQVDAETFYSTAKRWEQQKKGAYVIEKDGEGRDARYILIDTEKVHNEPIILDGLNKSGESVKYMLKQEFMAKAIKQTAAGHQWYLFE